MQFSEYHRKGSTVSNEFCDFQDKYIGHLLSWDLKWAFLDRGDRVQPPTNLLSRKKAQPKQGYIGWPGARKFERIHRPSHQSEFLQLGLNVS